MILDRKEVILQNLVDFFGAEAHEPIQYFEYNWAAEPHNGVFIIMSQHRVRNTCAGGCPVPHIPPGVLSACGSALRAPVGRIHWAGMLMRRWLGSESHLHAGTETATEWSGFLNGAIQAGERAAQVNDEPACAANRSRFHRKCPIVSTASPRHRSPNKLISTTITRNARRGCSTYSPLLW